VRLYAISDLHVGSPRNRSALDALPPHPDDWLAVAGDVAEHEELVIAALRTLARRFARVLWTPGNHELWTLPGRETLRGRFKYERLVERCREIGVTTPEDEFPLWPLDPKLVVAPIFMLYDYSFRPPEIPFERALDWAMEADLLCTDEILLHPDPYPSRQAWCRARVSSTRARLDAIPADKKSVLISHFPLRQDVVLLPAVPRFSIWCGTTETEDWHLRYRALAVISGHLHVPRREHRDGVRFEEVSFGNPGQWDERRGLDGHLRLVLDGGALVEHGS
jgi:predicted phosphodiesterase